MILTHLALFSFFDGAGTAVEPPEPVAPAAEERDTHDGWGGADGHPRQSKPYERVKQDRDEPRKSLESAFEDAEPKPAQPATARDETHERIEAEARKALADKRAREAAARLEAKRKADRIAQAEAERVAAEAAAEAKRQAVLREEEMALFECLCRLPWP